jgi:C4-type Zn-finger protein
MHIQCPYCWEDIDIEEIPFSEETVELVLDCEVCCRPIAITATWDDEDEAPWLDVRPES